MVKSPKSTPVQRVEDSDFDPASLRAVAEAMFSQLNHSRLSPAVDRAQEIMFDAWECAHVRDRVALAHKALKISNDCADAWTLLGQETARRPDEALDLFGKAVTAGEKALGKAAFVEDVGMFWGLIETRPYMRARHALALAQWEAGRREEAVANVEGMLTLNPNDNQGVRYLLLDWLQRLGHDAAAATLIKRYRNDGGTEWLWPIALAAYRKSGDGVRSRKALGEAMTANPHVAPFLTGRRKLPRHLPDYVAMGSKEEAAACAEQFMDTWRETPGAVQWVTDQMPPALAAKRPKPRT